jgi:uncharacterized protein involved in exopolysaccharide biosynthesis
MQMTTPAACAKLAAATTIIGAIAGAIAGGAISFVMPQRYVSTAMMRVTPRTVGGEPTWQTEAEASHRLQDMQTEIFSRASLAEIIQRPGIELYQHERFIYPMEDLIEDMRSRDLHIEPVQPRAFRISFEYPDRGKAQAVVRALTARFSEFNTAKAGNELIEVLNPANLPEKPSQPNRLAVMAIGLTVGLALGLCLSLGVFLLRTRHTDGYRYARLIAFSATCGALVGGIVSFALPESYVSTAVMRVFPYRDAGAGAAQLETEPAERLHQLTEDILSRGSLSELIQRPSLDLYHIERHRRPMEDIVNDMRHRDIRIAPALPAGLAGLGQATSFQISFKYANPDKAQAVVRELVTKFVEGNVTAERKLHRDKMPGSLAFEVVDPATLPANPVSPNGPAAAAIGLGTGILLGAFLALRRGMAARRQTAPLAPCPPYWRHALAAAALGAIAAGLASFAIPNRYVSTAVLRLTSPNGQAGGDQMLQMFGVILSRDSLSEIILRPALQLYTPERTRRPLEGVVKQMRDRDLRVEPVRDSPLGGRATAFTISFEYSDREKAHACVQALVNKFIEGNIGPHPPRDAAHLFDNGFVEGGLLPREAVMTAAPAAANPANLGLADLLTSGGTVSTQARATDLFAGNLVEGHDDVQDKPGIANLEVLDSASMPEEPVGPNRVNISAAGCLAGLLLGIAIARARRHAPHSAPA